MNAPRGRDDDQKPEYQKEGRDSSDPGFFLLVDNGGRKKEKVEKSLHFHGSPARA